MQCPYCGKAMAEGYIPNGGQPVQWLPVGERPPFLSFTTGERGVPLRSRFRPIRANGYAAEAHYCPDCKLVIAPAGE